MTTNKQNPYESGEIFHVSCTDEYETSLNTFYKFNSYDSAILVTNIVPLVPLKGVSVVHIADSYPFLTLRMVIDRVHKRYLAARSNATNTDNTDLIIYSHIATHPTEVSADESLHETLANHIKEANRIYTGLISMGGNIVFDPTSGLIVV